MKCPLLNKECIKDKCAFWISLDMFDQVNRKMYQEHKCAVVAIPPMLIELIGKTNGVGAAVESSRNETLKRQDVLLSLATGRMINGAG